MRACGKRGSGQPGPIAQLVGNIARIVDLRSIGAPGAIFAVLLVAGLWTRPAAMSAPAMAFAPSHRSYRLPPLALGTEAGARIAYPSGHYPALRMPGGQVQRIRSLLDVQGRLTYGDYVWDADGVPPGRVWVRIDLASQLLSVFRGGDEIGTAVIIFGTKAKPTPVGIFHILDKSAYYYSRTYNAPMPYALRLTIDGVALHASSVRERFATHGCVGLPREFARLLFDAVSKGDEVAILPAKG